RFCVKAVSTASVVWVAGIGAGHATPFAYGDFLQQALTVQERSASNRSQEVQLAQAISDPGKAKKDSSTGRRSTQADVQSVSLYPGEVRVMSIPNVERVAIEN